MKHKIFVACLGLALVGCSSRTGKAPVAADPAPKSDSSSTGSTPEGTQPPVDAKGESQSTNYDIQISAINFLTGGLEQCDFSNKVLDFSTEEKGRKVSICENSLVELYALSDSGIISFHAIERSGDNELRSTSAGGVMTVNLGAARETVRVSFENPYGFSFVMAEDVTGIDGDLLAQWNDLNTKASHVRAKVLMAQRNGGKPAKKDLAELNALEAKLSALAKKMEDTRVKR